MQHKIQDCCILSNHVPLILNVFLLDIFIGCDKKQLTTWSQQHKNMAYSVGTGRPLLSPNSFKKGEAKRILYKEKWYSHHRRIALEIRVHESGKTCVTQHLTSTCCHWN
jgi:hypothetical protein